MNVKQLRQECDDLIRSGKGDHRVIVKSLAPWRSPDFSCPLPMSPLAGLSKMRGLPYVEAVFA